MKLNQLIMFFKKEVNRFLEFHGLVDYEIYFEKEEDITNRASCSVQSPNRIATFRYEENWLKETNDLNDISKTCYHEVLELLFSKLRDFAVNREITVTQREVDDEVHKIIRILENKYFEKIN